MSTKTYRLFDGVDGVIGPNRSPWMSWRTLDARYCVDSGNTCLACFPSKQDSHFSFSTLMHGIPMTSSCLIIVFIELTPIGPSLACHLADSLSAIVLRHFFRLCQ